LNKKEIALKKIKESKELNIGGTRPISQIWH
jgi:hypothetical protein